MINRNQDSFAKLNEEAHKRFLLFLLERQSKKDD
jgi:hypothetical protein